MAPHLISIGMEAARAAAWLAILSVVFIPLERLFAERRQPVLRRQFAVDLGYYALNSLLTVPLLTAAAGLLAAVAHHVEPPALGGWAAGLPLWAQVLVTLVVSELGTYWGHRWSHSVPLLWRFHAIHHSAPEVDWLTSSRGHPVDLLFTRLCGMTLVCLCGLARPGGGEAPVALLLASVVAIFWGYFVHANLPWRLGWLSSVIATPAFHRWHHSNASHRDQNFASTLPVYDLLFGTFHLPKRAMPVSYGIDAKLPDGLTAQLAEPFLPARGSGSGRFSSDIA